MNEGGLESSKREVELSPAVNKEDPMSLTIKSENKNLVQVHPLGIEKAE